MLAPFRQKTRGKYFRQALLISLAGGTITALRRGTTKTW